MSNIVQVDSISLIHDMLGLEKPRHPLVSVITIDDRVTNYDYGDTTFAFGFYQVALKDGIRGQIQYGRNTYDFQEGTMVFSKPGQVMSFSTEEEQPKDKGWVLLFHPDLIRKSELGKHIDRYSFFDYDINEALHLSDQEKSSLSELAEKIQNECCQNMDRHTQKLIISNVELMLDYCMRYYDRQFYVRTNLNQDLASQFERQLKSYFESQQALDQGLPTVKFLGEVMNMSPSYLSDMLKKETGRTAQQHIQDAIVDRAKTLLLATTDQVSQVAYELGFEYPQHFSKMFKNHTGMSPGEYRKIQ
ncbi:MAG: helix-turn-helix transcriptional regulator [Pseudomonadota bacterium]|nr:helix-turn-helix transcriptional regulator [Pseudomonadota bacterium]